VAVRITDTGIGIDAEQQRRIFEAFAQGDGTTARLYGGTGLGLSISKELVALLGGELTVSSVVGHGSCFTVFLPWAARPASPAREADGPVLPSIPQQPLRAPAVEAVGLRGVQVLLVDDDYRNLFALTALLERGGAHVTSAESGADALAVLARMPEVEVILTDIMMPVMDGYATIRAIRRLDGFSHVPIIAVTSKVVAGERQRCLDAGANDYVPKPVDTTELLATLTPWLPTPRRPLP
jgi:CheY-like chemotaxis protein